MTATFTVLSGNTTMTFVYTAPTAKVQSIVGDCAEYLFTHGYGNHGTEDKPILFLSLSNQQKLDMVDLYLKQCVVDAGNSMKSNRAQDVARNTQDASKYTL